MVLLLTILILMTLLGIDIPWGEIIRLVSSILNSKFITSAITSWPLGIVIIALIFKKGIFNIMENRKVQVSAGGGNGVNIAIGDLIETTKENLKDAHKKVVKDEKNVIDIPEITMSKEYKELESMMIEALLDPAKSIKNTWEIFHLNLRKIVDFLLENTDLSFEGDSLHVMDVLYENNKVSKATANAIKGLFEIFQLAEDKSTKKDIDKVEFANKARDYYKLCVDALEQLRSELSKTLKNDLQS
ncbi:hypothetical protein [Bacillus paralicheniformis]